MIIFADTSALVKRYIEEIGSDKVDEIFSHADGLIVSAITKAELNSAFARRLKDKSIDKKSYEMALNEFNNDFEYIDVILYNSKTETETIKSIKKYAMKTLDAIQLASARLSLADVFITSYKKLYDIAMQELSGECIYI